MAERDNTSKSRPGRNRASTAPRKTTARKPSAALKPNPVLPEAIEDAIEEQRSCLMKAESILHCVLIAMDENDGLDDDDCDADGPHFPTMIEMARGLVDQSIRRLDAVNLEPKAGAKKNDEGDDYDPGETDSRRFGKDQVREPYVPYLCQGDAANS